MSHWTYRSGLAVAASFAAMMTSAAAWAASPTNPLLPHDLSPWGMFMNADIVVKFVMIGLAFASLITWTVCVAKLVELRNETATARKRIAVLARDATLADAQRDSVGHKDPVALIVQAAVTESTLSGGTRDDGFKERVALRLERAENAMARKIARSTGILATIGATAPFVGLFGTVWGIMNAFIGISESHTTNLAVVAPGIAEALLATAMGLIAAIPAVVIYNQLVRMIAAYRALLGDASANVMLLISRDQGRPVRASRAAE